MIQGFHILKKTPGAIRWLLALSFCMNLGFYALIPYLTLYLTGSYGWALSMAGLVLSVRQFSQQGVAFLGGIIADRCGYKLTMILGMIVRGLGFLAFAFCTETWHFFIAAIFSGLGGSLFEPAVSASYAVLTPEGIRKDVFGVKNVLNNVSVVGSQLVGTALIMVDFYWLSIFAGGLYFLCAGLALLVLPPLAVKATKSNVLKSFQTVILDRSFMLYTFILIGHYYIYMQLFLAIPQFVEDTLQKKMAVGTVLSTVAIVTILFQMKVLQWLSNYSQRFTLIGLGTLIMAFGLFLFSFSNQLWMILLDASIFAIGTMISVPYLIDMVPYFAPKNQLGAYYGFNGYALAIGGSIGTSLGGWAYELGKQLYMPWLPWGICLAIGFLVCWHMYRMEQRMAVQTKRVAI
ncbi:MDR family MFS transporter [Brevibacillus laterosporus]|uniref:MFS transporter n=1 Tax=Brevibacillus laterosporus TaxID=1465 RepID=A0AAP3G854_BRELA|nr:MFS transporter [Brevibacillus laterosporus]MCR8981078.1 MFS transporter [Brevibacillus laterosporus]MCZ0808233.1 MFS transporter [Brevibacillus laterosporus]MCZ0826592.1 MFS transporter [Brevibacillus laterosporus]MCZ0850405.1 MFS transporter [Brevibacillus laterosporus]